MRTRLIRLATLGAVAATPLVAKKLRDRAVERNRAKAAWLRPDEVRFDTPRRDRGTS